VQLRQSTAISPMSKGLGPASRKRMRGQAQHKDGNGDAHLEPELVCSSEQKTDEPETLVVNTEIEPQQVNSDILVILSDTECDASREVAALQDQVGPDHGDKELSLGNTSCLKASIPGTAEQPHQSDKKRSERARQQRKPSVRKSDQTSRHSAQLVKEKKNVEKGSRASRNMSNNDSLRLGADLRQHHRRHEQYKQHKDYSHSGTKTGFTRYDSRKHEKRDSFAKHSFRDHSSHSVMRRRNHSGKYPERSSRRQVLSCLEDISSGEEENVEYRDGGGHCCRFCSVTFETIPCLLEHLQSAAHEQVFIFL